MTVGGGEVVHFGWGGGGVVTAWCDLSPKP